MAMSLTVILAALGACAAQPAGTPVTAVPEPPYRILVTNDDGIESEGIRQLALRLAEIGEVVVVAPEANRSGSSQSTTLFNSRATATPTDFGDKVEAWAINGTPSDSAAFGIRVFGKDDPFDLVISGINYGANYGTAYYYSGTVGAAFQGLADGIPAIAVSQDHRREEWSISADFAAEVAQSVLVNPLPPGEILSINVPQGEIRGVRARAGFGSTFLIEFEQAEDEQGAYYQPRIIANDEPPSDSDLKAFQDGFITVTPLRLDRNAYDSLEDLNQRPFIRDRSASQ
jgi:5'-nucleotidase